MLKPSEAKSDTALKPRLIGWLAAQCIRLLVATLRVRVSDESGLLREPPDGPVIWVFWHNRLLIVPSLYGRCLKNRPPATVLTSASGDGAILAAFMRHFGLGAVRGSTSRRGARALLECARLLRKKHYLGVTPDGPRGPVYRLQPGVIQLARLCRAAIQPIQVEYTKAWRLKTWDRFFIPKPFSAVRVRFLPLEYAGDGDPEVRRVEVENLLQPEVP